MIAEVGVQAVAVTAARINVERCGHVVAVEFGVVVDAVHGLHHVVVVGEGDEGARRDACHLHVGAVILLVLLACVLAEQVLARALMTVAVEHRYDGIEEYLEVGLGVVL